MVRLKLGVEKYFTMVKVYQNVPFKGLFNIGHPCYAHTIVAFELGYIQLLSLLKFHMQVIVFFSVK